MLLLNSNMFSRFGHQVLTTCSYCQSFDDFALYAFPGPLLEYIREIAFVGVCHPTIFTLHVEIIHNSSLDFNLTQILHGAPPPSRTWYTARSFPGRGILDSNRPGRYSTRNKYPSDQRMSLPPLSLNTNQPTHSGTTTSSKCATPSSSSSPSSSPSSPY